MLKKNFEGRWLSNGIIYFTSAATRETVEEFQIVELEIKKIAEQIYLCVFTQIYPPIANNSVSNSNQFVCVGTQSTENKYLLQSGTGGLNTFYFKTDTDSDSNSTHDESCCKEEVLYTTFNDNYITDVFKGWISGSLKFNRI
jgi:hypothetical protein